MVSADEEAHEQLRRFVEKRMPVFEEEERMRRAHYAADDRAMLVLRAASLFGLFLDELYVSRCPPACGEVCLRALREKSLRRPPCLSSREGCNCGSARKVPRRTLASASCACALHAPRRVCRAPALIYASGGMVDCARMVSRSVHGYFAALAARNENISRVCGRANVGRCCGRRYGAGT
jgi:hypothetical protein